MARNRLPDGRTRGTPRAAITYRGAWRNLARTERNKRGTDKRDARAAMKAWAEYKRLGGRDIAEIKKELGLA